MGTALTPAGQVDRANILGVVIRALNLDAAARLIELAIVDQKDG